jgi:hypothetical protein
MLVQSGRVHEKIHFPAFHTTIQVVTIQPGVVRPGVGAPEAPAEAPAAARLGQLVDRRLAVSQRGLAELRRLLRAGEVEGAEVLLDKVAEDLHLLRRRLGPGSGMPDRFTPA